MERVRIDKWLWAARFFKTRSVAAAAVVGGRVHVNGMRAKPSKEVRVRDTVEVTIGAVRRTVQVTGVSDRRGPASVAAMLYSETPESVAARERHALERRLGRPLGADSVHGRQSSIGAGSTPCAARSGGAGAKPVDVAPLHHAPGACCGLVALLLPSLVYGFVSGHWVVHVHGRRAAGRRLSSSAAPRRSMPDRRSPVARLSEDRSNGPTWA